MENRRTCIACGTRFQLTGKYHGNYCSECHDEWLDVQRDRPSTPRPLPPTRGRRAPWPADEPSESPDDESDTLEE
ncbi:DUF7564 family protein [Haloarchaeobius sp. TZWWS8]|uniref:DUF7564 family protein n=1 Tax=Haloarchaeobius sp. TZWWS8 TaxID=3446121 RepID=UPI003EC06168